MTTTSPGFRNGVDVPNLFATLDAVRDNPQIASFQFRAVNRWIDGTCSETTIDHFHGALQELRHVECRTYRADHPVVLTGQDRGSTPVEFVLHALAACLSAGIANIAAARGVQLDEVNCTVEGDIDLVGLLGLDPSVRNGCQAITVSYRLRGPDPEALAQVVAQSQARSAVLDMLRNPVPVTVSVDAGRAGEE